MEPITYVTNEVESNSQRPFTDVPNLLGNKLLEAAVEWKMNIPDSSSKEHATQAVAIYLVSFPSEPT